MKSIRLLAITLLVILGSSYSTTMADSDQFKIDRGPRYIGLTIIGGMYTPGLDWTIDRSFSVTENSSTSDARFKQVLTGPGMSRNIGGLGLVYRSGYFGLRLTYQRGSMTEMVYDAQEISDASFGDLVVDSLKTQAFADSTLPIVWASTSHITLAAMRYFGLRGESVNLFAGGAFGVSILSYSGYEGPEIEEDKPGWGYNVAPLVGFEARVTPKLGLAVEAQYVIGSTFSHEFSYEYEYAVDEPANVVVKHHLNTNGPKLQASLYYYIFD